LGSAECDVSEGTTTSAGSSVARPAGAGLGLRGRNLSLPDTCRGCTGEGGADRMVQAIYCRHPPSADCGQFDIQEGRRAGRQASRQAGRDNWQAGGRGYHLLVGSGRAPLRPRPRWSCSAPPLREKALMGRCVCLLTPTPTPYPNPLPQAPAHSAHPIVPLPASQLMPRRCHHCLCAHYPLFSPFWFSSLSLRLTSWPLPTACLQRRAATGCAFSIGAGHYSPETGHTHPGDRDFCRSLLSNQRGPLGVR